MRDPLRGFLAIFGIYNAFWAANFLYFRDELHAICETASFCQLLNGCLAVIVLAAAGLNWARSALFASFSLLLARYLITHLFPTIQAPETGLMNLLSLITFAGLFFTRGMPRQVALSRWSLLAFVMNLSMAAAYLYSAYEKWMTPSWRAGWAFQAMYEGVFGKVWFAASVEQWPRFLVDLFTWFTIVIQASPVLGLFSFRFFLISQIGLIMMHAILLISTYLFSVSLGMLVGHTFLLSLCFNQRLLRNLKLLDINGVTEGK